MPKAVSLPSGEISVTRPPTVSPRRLRETLADRDPVVAEIAERAGDDVFGDQRATTDVVGTDAAHQRAGGAGIAGRHDLRLDQRRRLGDVRHLAHLGGDRIEIGERVACAVHPEMAVEAEDAADQVGAEPVHHRHHDDQGGDPERDAEQREDRDDRNKAFLPPRPQIAERHHPLEGTEDHASEALSRTAGEGGRGRKPADG